MEITVYMYKYFEADVYIDYEVITTILLESVSLGRQH